MRKFIMSLVALGFLTAPVLMLQGCNNDRRADIEEGEKEVVLEQVNLQCGEPFFIKVIDSYDANVSVEYNGTVESFKSEWGIDLQYTVVSDCNVCDDCNTTEANSTVNTIPKDGACPCGYMLNDCGTKCVLPEVECDEGFHEKEDICFPDLYIPFEDVDGNFKSCIKGFDWNATTEVCGVVEE